MGPSGPRPGAADAHLPLAEETGAIDDIDIWVLAEACRQAADWKNRYAEHARMHLNANLSPVRMTRPGLTNDIFAVLDRTGLSPRDLVAEVTASVILDDDSAAPILQALRAAPIRTGCCASPGAPTCSHTSSSSSI